MQEKPLNYLALGDSIATGCLTYWAATDGYPVYLARQLARRRPVNLTNYAVNGDTSGGLLWKLTHLANYRRAVRNAGLITLSIGGNDLLRAASVPGFTSINKTMGRQGQACFLRHFPHIISTIRQLNPDATLVVMTIYNPYCSSRNLGGATCDRGLHELTERYLASINSAIWAGCGQDYAVADVHSTFFRYRFGRMNRVVSLYPSSGFLLRNPHPSPYGHRLIARLHLQALEDAV